jgi:NhaA family Na+:H+ antiporter
MTATDAEVRRDRREVAPALVLLAAAGAAMVWANSPWSDGYQRFWASEAGPAGLHLRLSARAWVGDLLMVVFFLVAGLEVGHARRHGMLRDARAAALPVVAALGGMVVPALIYAAVTAGGPGARGWAIPMATDLAFAVGVLALVRPAAPPALRVFLLTLAIADDVGAIVVLAVVYRRGGAPGWAAVALVALAATVLLRRWLVANGWRLGAMTVVLWFVLHRAGFHAALVGVVTGVLVATADVGGVAAVRPDRLRARFEGWSAFVVLPLFALANAGVAVDGAAVRSLGTGAVPLGVLIGLVVGKPLGIGLATVAGVRLGGLRLPAGVRGRDVAGVAVLAGIGFTVALLVTELALAEPLAGEARLAVLVASSVAAAIGAVVLRGSGVGDPDGQEPAG